jgi:sulfur-oxidizing protein SoxZ
MRIRVTLIGDTADVKVLMNHPMETGLRKDAKTGQMVPAHYITEVTAQHNGKLVLSALWGPAVSQNPFLQFRFKGGAAGDKVVVAWKDTKGETRTDEIVLS